MSKKHLKEQNKWADLNIIDVLSTLSPDGTSKYIPLLLKEFKNVDIKRNERYKDDMEYYQARLKDHTTIPSETIDAMSFYHLRVYWSVIEYFTDFVDKTVLERHHFHHINNRLENPDISSYKSIDDLKHQTKIADIKYLEKEVKEAIHVLHEDNEWLIVIPLTHESSLKYGASTKWCTASKGNPETFYRYSRRGNLYYMINKKSYYKCAAYFPNEDGYEGTFQLFNEEDQRTDTMVMNIQKYIYDIIRGHKNMFKSNKDFTEKKYPEFSSLYDNNEEKLSEHTLHQVEEAVPVPVHYDEETVLNMNDAVQEVETRYTHTEFENPSLVSNIETFITEKSKNTLLRRLYRKLFGYKMIFIGVPVYHHEDASRVMTYLGDKLNEQDNKGYYRFVLYPKFNGTSLEILKV